jgi:hypothetical protein
MNPQTSIGKAQLNEGASLVGVSPSLYLYEQVLGSWAQAQGDTNKSDSFPLSPSHLTFFL